MRRTNPPGIDDDAFVWFDETTPVTPLVPEHGRTGVPETYPFGL